MPESPRIAQRLRREPKQTFQLSRTWIVLAAIVLAIIIWAIGARRSSVSKPAPPNTAASANNNTWPTRTLTPEGTAAKSQPTAAPTRVDTVPSKAARIRDAQASIKGPVWRVVLYTYSHSDLAEKQAHLVNSKHPELGAQVFTPNGQAGPYLVVAGGRMDRDQATSLRQKAVRLGLPRDSYIQNYQQ